MKSKVIFIIIFLGFFNALSYGQYTVLLLNGKSLNSSSVSIKDDPVALVVNDENQSVSKNEILCIIPKKKKSFTFSQKNNRKIRIPKKWISHNYHGEDRAVILAIKYYKSPVDVNELYDANSDNNTISQEEFENTFGKTQKKIKRKNIATYIGAGIALSIAVVSLTGTLNEINNLE